MTMMTLVPVITALPEADEEVLLPAAR
jgi:hypothetical protein